jgi:hypothetical protein
LTSHQGSRIFVRSCQSNGDSVLGARHSLCERCSQWEERRTR